MASGDLVEDPQPNLIAAAHRNAGRGREYEFAFPLAGTSPGSAAWERDRSYQIAVLVGPGRDFARVTPDTWMSDQTLIRIGSRSAVSIYDPPIPPPPRREEHERGGGHDTGDAHEDAHRHDGGHREPGAGSR